MPNWETMTVLVVLDASSGAYRVVRKGEHALKDDAPLLSDFLLEMGRQGWKYVGLEEGMVTLQRPYGG